MGVLARLGAFLAPAPAITADRLTAAFAIGDTGGTTTAPAVSTLRAQAVARNIALSIPAMRKGRAALMTIATFRLGAWTLDGSRVPDPVAPRWLNQFEPNSIQFRSLSYLLDDAIWYDRSIWKITRDIAARPAYLERIHPQRIETHPHPRDPDVVDTWFIDGRSMSDETFRRDHVVFDWAGMGGLRRFGAPLLQLYGDLQAAAGRYARAPHPYGILKNSGAELTDEEIDALLAEWELAREERGIGYTEGDIDYTPTQGFSARELQLTEAREHAALEVARLLALPARAVDAKSGDPLTYSTVVENRRDFLEALRPWMAPITQTLSLNDRAAMSRGVLLPRDLVAEFDADAYLRDDPKTRMETWRAGLDAEVLDLADVRAREPLARKAPR